MKDAEGNFPSDFISVLAASDSQAPLEESARALKDRLLATRFIEPEEHPLLEALAGSALSDIPDLAARGEALRRMCIAWVSAPAFQLSQMHEPVHKDLETLLLKANGSAACEKLTAFWDGVPAACTN